MVLGNIVCDLDSKVKIKGKKMGICDGVPSTASLVNNEITPLDWLEIRSTYNANNP